MMKVWFSYPLLVVVVGALFSCSDFNKKGYLRELSSLQKTVDSIETVLIENKIDTFPRLLTSARMLELHLKDEILQDTLELSIAQQINEFQLGLNDLKPLDSTYNSIFEAIPHQRFSLQLLENEVQNDSGERHKYEENIDFERKRVEGLQSTLEEYVSRKRKALDAIQRNFSPLTAFSLELKSTKN